MSDRAPAARPRSRARTVVHAALVVVALAVTAGAWACSPIYVIKAGIAEAKILHARRPITQVVTDSSTDADTRTKLTYVLEARRFAAERLGMKPGASYTTYVHLEHDTLALVLSAAYKDRLVNKTWWFPIVGHVPYKGFFDEDDALAAQKKLESDGFDTYLRPTSAFSTLGWFADPILSTVLNTSDDVEVVTTVLHELAHGYLFVPGQVGFNESYATFVGHTAAEQFFCTRQGGGPDTVKCHRAEARWRDFERFSVFVDGLVSDLDRIYDDSTLTREQKISRRQVVFQRSIEHFKQDVQPTFEAYSFASFIDTPLNNATLLARIRYFHRLPDFQALLDAHHGDLRSVLQELKAKAPAAKDPFDVLPTNGKLPPPAGDTLQ
jgi:predicted aminopeptidase